MSTQELGPQSSSIGCPCGRETLANAASAFVWYVVWVLTP